MTSSPAARVMVAAKTALNKNLIDKAKSHKLNNALFKHSAITYNRKNIVTNEHSLRRLIQGKLKTFSY